MKRSRLSRRHARACALLLALGVGCSGEAGRASGEDDDAQADERGEPDPSGRRDAGADDDAPRGAQDGGRAPTGEAGPGTTPRSDAGRPSASGPRDAATSTPASTRDAASGPSDADMPTGTPGDVCARWNADRTGLSEGAWSGSVASCDPGDMSPEARAGALRLINLYRALAGLAPVTMSEEANRLAQACALLMRANGTITHTPPSSWKCYTAEAAKAAGSSSLSSGAAVASVDGYMIDPGNPTTIGHRRWILSSWLTQVGFGSADRFSCQYQPARAQSGRSGKAWVAWPPAGQLPIQAFGSARFTGSLDQTGWTIQSDSINLRTAQVTVRSSGVERPVSVTQLGTGYGSTHALRFNPSGWTTKAGETYHVTVSGVATPIEYDVEVVDCP